MLARFKAMAPRGPARPTRQAQGFECAALRQCENVWVARSTLWQPWSATRSRLAYAGPLGSPAGFGDPSVLST